jgi:hypothetical protein
MKRCFYIEEVRGRTKSLLAIRYTLHFIKLRKLQDYVVYNGIV